MKYFIRFSTLFFVFTLSTLLVSLTAAESKQTYLTKTLKTITMEIKNATVVRVANGSPPSPPRVNPNPTPAPTPPLKLGDLNKCLSQLSPPKDACDQVCATQDLCTFLCTYRLNANGQCVPKAECGPCAEVPPDDLPMDPSGGGNTR